MCACVRECDRECSCVRVYVRACVLSHEREFMSGLGGDDELPCVYVPA